MSARLAMSTVMAGMTWSALAWMGSMWLCIQAVALERLASGQVPLICPMVGQSVSMFAQSAMSMTMAGMTWSALAWMGSMWLCLQAVALERLASGQAPLICPMVGQSVSIFA